MRELLGKLLGNSLNPNSVRAVPKSKTFDSRRLHHTFYISGDFSSAPLRGFFCAYKSQRW